MEAVGLFNINACFYLTLVLRTNSSHALAPRQSMSLTIVGERWKNGHVSHGDGNRRIPFPISLSLTLNLCRADLDLEEAIVGRVTLHPLLSGEGCVRRRVVDFKLWLDVVELLASTEIASRAEV